MISGYLGSSYKDRRLSAYVLRPGEPLAYERLVRVASLDEAVEAAKLFFGPRPPYLEIRSNPHRVVVYSTGAVKVLR